MKETPNEGKKAIRFEIKAEPKSEVFLCGSFNDWNPTQFRMKEEGKDGQFRINLMLPMGRHEYKFVVNGEWLVDSSCTEQVGNIYGGMNGVIVVEEE